MRRLLWIGLLLPGLALAADRHVYLNSTGGGTQLNDCPNPAHNAKGTSNTDELQYCAGSAGADEIIGTAAGRLTSGACTTDGGTATAVTNGVSADVDGDGTNEFVYGHPQACVWNMDTSDDCDVHAGTYTAAGAQCRKDCGDTSAHNVASVDRAASLAGCDGYDCWFSSVVAYGHGPNLSNDGYGTAADPSYLRAANSNGSIDTWDLDNDKIPGTVAGETAGYPAILSGDRDGDAAFDQTTQPSSTLLGDTFHTVLVGCVNAEITSNPTAMCGDSFLFDERGIEIDTDANGTFDVELKTGNTYFDRKRVGYFKIKDLQFTRYNGGNDWSAVVDASTQSQAGRFGFHGSNYGDVGLGVDHIYMVNNDANYSQARDCSVAGDGNDNCVKTMWAEFSDRSNYRCAQSNANNRLEIARSLVHVSTARLSMVSDHGCPLNMHDNRIIVDHVNNPSRLNAISDGEHRANVFYFKQIDSTVPGSAEVNRVWNNEFIIVNMGNSNRAFFDVQNFGNSNGEGLGAIWFYGNLVRTDPNVVSSTGSINHFNGRGCRTGTLPEYTNDHVMKYFNNTFDNGDFGEPWVWEKVCTSVSSPAGPGEQYVDRNNAFWDVTTVCSDNSTSFFDTITRSNSCNGGATQSPSCTNACASATKSNWFNDTATTPTYWNGLTLYAPEAGGNLINAGSCDPDGNGTNGVDYDGDGVNDTQWTDIAGNNVSCVGAGTIEIGAIQAADSSSAVCGNNLKEGAEVCDDSDLNSQTCELQSFSCGTLSCNAGCTAFVTTSCVATTSCGNAAVDTVGTCNEVCDGLLLDGQNCGSQGLGCGPLTCHANCLSFVSTACTASCTEVLTGVTIQGVTVD